MPRPRNKALVTGYWLLEHTKQFSQKGNYLPLIVSAFAEKDVSYKGLDARGLLQVTGYVERHGTRQNAAVVISRVLEGVRRRRTLGRSPELCVEMLVQAARCRVETGGFGGLWNVARQCVRTGSVREVVSGVYLGKICGEQFNEEEKKQTENTAMRLFRTASDSQKLTLITTMRTSHKTLIELLHQHPMVTPKGAAGVAKLLRIHLDSTLYNEIAQTVILGGVLDDVIAVIEAVPEKGDFAEVMLRLVYTAVASGDLKKNPTKKKIEAALQKVGVESTYFNLACCKVNPHIDGAAAAAPPALKKDPWRTWAGVRKCRILTAAHLQAVTPELVHLPRTGSPLVFSRLLIPYATHRAMSPSLLKSVTHTIPSLATSTRVLPQTIDAPSLLWALLRLATTHTGSLEILGVTIRTHAASSLPPGWDRAMLQKLREEIGKMHPYTRGKIGRLPPTVGERAIMNEKTPRN